MENASKFHTQNHKGTIEKTPAFITVPQTITFPWQNRKNQPITFVSTTQPKIHTQKFIIKRKHKNPQVPIKQRFKGEKPKFPF